LQQLNDPQHTGTGPAGPPKTEGQAASGDPAISVYGLQQHVAWRDSAGAIWDAFWDSGSPGLGWRLQQINKGAVDTACDPSGCISLSKFSVNLSNLLENNTVGFVSIIGDLPPISSGRARTCADAPTTAMSPDLPTNVMSVSKVLTTVGVLQSLAKHGLTIDDKISPFIYPDWAQGPGINTITFRDLLTHKSGFRQDATGSICGGKNTTYSVLQTIIANGVTPANKAAIPTYNNCNFAIFRELLPAMEGQSFPATASRANQSANFYIQYMNDNVFAPVGVPRSECKPPAEINHMLSYPFPAGSTKGTDWDDWTLACGGGGWVLSSSDLHKVIRDLASGNALLSTVEKNLMSSNSSQLGWDNTVRRDCSPVSTASPPPFAVCKNGSFLDATGHGTWSYAGIISCNVPVVVIVNSRIADPANQLQNVDIIVSVQKALNGATVQGTPKNCP
jgi:CubicO group peptidase (beta-lactamase class C family)